MYEIEVAGIKYKVTFEANTGFDAHDLVCVIRRQDGKIFTGTSSQSRIEGAKRESFFTAAYSAYLGDNLDSTSPADYTSALSFDPEQTAPKQAEMPKLGKLSTNDDWFELIDVAPSLIPVIKAVDGVTKVDHWYADPANVRTVDVRKGYLAHDVRAAVATALRAHLSQQSSADTGRKCDVIFKEERASGGELITLYMWIDADKIPSVNQLEGVCSVFSISSGGYGVSLDRRYDVEVIKRNIEKLAK